MRRRFAPPRRRRETDHTARVDELHERGEADAAQAASARALRLWHGTAGLQHIAQSMWSADYTALFEAEYELNLLACGAAGYQLPPSTYRARLKGEAAERYDWRQRQQKRDEMAIALHANNMQRWSPSLLARSVAYFNLTTVFMHGEETRQRRLASRPTTFEFMRMMRDCRPKAEWEAAQHVSFYVADQTYEWIGMKKRGARKTLERLDATGRSQDATHVSFARALHVLSALHALCPNVGCVCVCVCVQACLSPSRTRCTSTLSS